jgi:uncharacterized protein YxjI
MEYLSEEEYLPEVPCEIGVFPQFFARRSETIVLKEKVLSLSGDDFHVKLADGTPLLRVEGQVMSISDRKRVYDERDNHLFDIVKGHFHVHTTYWLEDPEGNEFMKVKNSLFQCTSPIPSSIA